MSIAGAHSFQPINLPDDSNIGINFALAQTFSYLKYKPMNPMYINEPFIVLNSIFLSLFLSLCLSLTHS